MKSRAVALEKNHVDNKDKLDDIEQYTRRQNFIFEGIPVNEDEDINKTIIQLVEKLNLKITDQDISIAHRLLSKKQITDNIRESNQEKQQQQQVLFVAMRNNTVTTKAKINIFSKFAATRKP